jgi:hypothetical protein
MYYVTILHVELSPFEKVVQLRVFLRLSSYYFTLISKQYRYIYKKENTNTYTNEFRFG